MVLVVGLVLPAVARAQDEQPSSRVLTMRDAMRMAISASPDAHAADARVDRADAEHDLAVSRYLPTAEASVRAGGITTQDTLIFRRDHYTLTTGYVEGRADVRWTLYDFGRTSNAVSAADASKRGAEHGKEATRAQVAKQAAGLYVTVIFDEQIVASKKTAVKHRSRFLVVARGLVEKGVRPSLDETRAKVNLEAARHDLVIAEARLATDRARLAAVLNIDSDKLPALAQPLLPNVDDDPMRAMAASEKSRPELAAAAADVEATDKRIDSARSGYLPRIGVDVGGSYRFTHRDFDDAVVPRREASALLVVSIPIFDWAIPANVDIARADHAAAQAREERTRRVTKLEAQESALGVRGARAAQARAKELSSTASQALAVMEARYASGLASALEIVDAEASDIEAREILAAADLRVQLATVELLTATGRSAQLGGT
jgi:outer membrane protein TolC